MHAHKILMYFVFLCYILCIIYRLYQWLQEKDSTIKGVWWIANGWREITNDKTRKLYDIHKSKVFVFLGYHYLACKAIKFDSDFNRSIVMHPFLLLSWSLMARAVSTASIRFEHISWEGMNKTFIVINIIFLRSNILY